MTGIANLGIDSLLSAQREFASLAVLTLSTVRCPGLHPQGPRLGLPADDRPVLVLNRHHCFPRLRCKVDIQIVLVPARYVRRTQKGSW